VVFISKRNRQCGGSGMVIPDPTFFHPGSRIRTVSIPDPHQRILSILTPKKAKKWFLSSKKYDPCCSSRIRMLTFSNPGSRIQGSKRHPIPDPGSGSATLGTGITRLGAHLLSYFSDLLVLYDHLYLKFYPIHSLDLMA
jgi:hypothetical protein